MKEDERRQIKSGGRTKLLWQEIEKVRHISGSVDWQPVGQVHLTPRAVCRMQTISRKVAPDTLFRFKPRKRLL